MENGSAPRCAGEIFWPRSMREAPRLDPEAPAPPPAPRAALLLNPFYAKEPRASFGKHVLTPSLALATVAGATPPGWDVMIWDENLLQGPPPLDPFPRVAGITVHLTAARRAYDLARWYRRRGALVVLGGLHVQSCPDEAARHADAIALGEGTQVWPRILVDAEAGRLAPRYAGSYRHPLQEEPFPRRDLIARRDFLTTLSLLATRGCRNRCGFCQLSTEGLDMPYLEDSAARVADQFRDSPEPYGVFIDNNLGSRPGFLRDLCRALRPLGKIWSAAVSIDSSDDPSLVREMALAGCTGVFIGFESLDGRNLDDAGKRTPRPEEYARRIGIFHENGIQVNGSFVFGFDHDRPDVFERTVRWVDDVRLECATYHILTPYPGTPLFRRLEAEGRLLHRDWERYDAAHAVFRPRHMTPQELEEGYSWCYRRTFSLGSIWRRRPRRFGEGLPYIAMSLLYKKMNFLWPFLIRHRLTGAFWRPLVRAARARRIRFRRGLEAAQLQGENASQEMPSAVGSVPQSGEGGRGGGPSRKRWPRR